MQPSDQDQLEPDAQLKAILAMPQLASVKGTADMLHAGILDMVPAEAGVDAATLYRMCVCFVTLAQNAGMGKQKELTDLYEREATALRKLLDRAAKERDDLIETVVEQRDLIARQEEMLGRALAVADFREYRLPH